MKISVKKLIYTAAAAFALAAAVIVITNLKPVLVISDSSNGKIFAEFEFDYDDTFSVSFIHSVNLIKIFPIKGILFKKFLIPFLLDV